ncbi:MAG: hypothetical protein S4CHLAM6_08210 [Chlamydiae bacterium]|nr:hypothetical protein [Chlamydiota bacterium]
MNRKDLLEAIELYKNSKWCSENDIELAHQFVDFIKKNDRCFQRELSHGHLTASCWLWNFDQSACLFTHHKKLNKWLQLGGHADGHTNLLEVAIKEAQEESGLLEIEALSPQIFDLSLHQIPANRFESAHLHYDVRYLLQVKVDRPFIVSSESFNLKWIKPEEFEKLDLDSSILKMQQKILL